MQSIEVTGLSDVGIAEDFSFAEVTLATRDGSSLRCRFQPKSLDMIVAQLAQILTHIRNHTASTDGYTTPPVTLASGVTAAAPAEGTHVVISITGANGVMFHFAMDAEIAARLRSEIEAAETSVREHPTQTRQ
jgi:hypothetical protein